MLSFVLNALLFNPRKVSSLDFVWRQTVGAYELIRFVFRCCTIRILYVTGRLKFWNIFWVSVAYVTFAFWFIILLLESFVLHLRWI
jgi:hypothetical protein